jgi:hypothetical protein
MAVGSHKEPDGKSADARNNIRHATWMPRKQMTPQGVTQGKS